MNKKRIWIGRWLLVVAAIHTVFGLLVGAGALGGMVRAGLFNTANASPATLAVSWFLLFGPLLALLGLAIGALERSGDEAASRRLGIGLLCLTIGALVLMPLSGFWLALPPAIALLRRRAGNAVASSMPA